MISIALLGWGCGPSASAQPDALQCSAEEKLCGESCITPATDPDNCGDCGTVCDEAALVFCEEGICVPPECSPGASEACYTGPGGTQGVGICKGGTRTCDDRGRWSLCTGEVTPQYETCDNELDDNCNGEVNEDEDLDGDGWTTCQGDCCDSPSANCGTPDLVNPGAFEVAGNDVDDDCDTGIDNQLAACDSGLASGSSDAMDYARAIDLCQTSVETGDPIDLRWGVISASLTRADGTGAPDPGGRSIRAAFGTNVTPQAGNAMALLSTGQAAAVGDTSPDYAAPQVGTNHSLSSGMPADWLAANAGDLPNAPGCPEPSGTDANDPVMLSLRIRVPTNAKSFKLAVDFYTSEYPEWVCSPFNDFFVVLLDSTWSGTPANPTDKNLAIYTAPDGSAYPVGVNLASGDTGLFRQCKNGTTGCTSLATSGSTTTCQSEAELAGTGHDVTNPPSALGAPGKCGSNNLAGGATSWLVTSGNVVPGEIIDLRIAIWDTSDNIYDSLVLVDDFQWSVDASEPGTDIIVD